MALLIFPLPDSALCQRSDSVLTRTEATGRREWERAEVDFRRGGGGEVVSEPRMRDGLKFQLQGGCCLFLLHSPLPQPQL